MGHFIFRSIFICTILMLLAGCSSQQPPESPEIILAKIDKKSISVDEFIRRAEYTVRPSYCNQNSSIDRKIILNSLIAEKLMAIEAGDTNRFMNTPEVQLQLRGRKEQAMRLEQFFRKAYIRVELDTTEIKKYYRNAGKEIQIEYFSVLDSATASGIQNKIDDRPDAFEAAFATLSPLEEIPKRTVTWTSYEHDLILDALYAQDLQPGQVVGPLKVADDQYLFMKIIDWQKTRPVMTDRDVQERWYQVSERLRQREAKKIYDQYIFSVMRGKEIEFSPTILKNVIRLFGPVYFFSNDTKHELTKSGLFNLDLQEINFEKFQTGLDEIAGETLFQVAGETWTVRQFLEEIKAHPLVFRKKQMRSNEFGKQMQLAIIDLVRDVYLTQEAYKDGYDRLPGVQRDLQMWRDNLNYLYYKNNWLKTVISDSVETPGTQILIDHYLNPEVDRLQEKYSDQVEIDVAKLETIRLTRIDMSVIQQNVPYAKPVPGFPMVTTDFRLDYGKRMPAGEEKSDFSPETLIPGGLNLN